MTIEPILLIFMK